jgi:VWFA-related protein
MIRSVMLLVAALMALAPQVSAPTLRILEPTEDTVLVGEVVLRAGFLGGTVRELVFQVDGLEVCRIIRSPFECRWNAGSRLGARVVRAVATLEDGRRVPAAQVRTKGVVVNDSTDVDSVLVTAHVTDGSGRFVPNLGPGDFRVLDDGEPQRVTILDTGGGGAEVLTALDVSGSMGNQMDDLRAVVRDFLERLRPADRVTIAGFNSAFFLVAERGADRETQRRAIAELEASGGTAIFDTLISGAELLATHVGRRVLVVFSDGEDMNSRATLEAARTSLHAADTLLYLVASGASGDPEQRRRLTQLSLETGGASYYASNLRDTQEHFRDIVDDLSRQYLLAFSPTRPLGDGKWRRLSVELRNPALRIRARGGYFATRRSR